MFLLCAAVSLCYGEQDYQYFLYTILLNTLVGGVLLICSRGAENRLTRRDGYCIVTFTWFCLRCLECCLFILVEESLR